MRKDILAAAALLSGLAVLLTACSKEILENPANGKDPATEQADTIPGIIRLTTEGYDSGTRTAVIDETVQWEGNEYVYINGRGYQVHVDGENAYIEAGNLSGAVYGFYNCGYSGSGNTTPTVTIPDRYESSFDGEGRQIIQLPMAAYCAEIGGALAFKHLTAAVKVMLWNDTGRTLYVERVIVKTRSYGINGSRVLDLADADCGLQTVAGAPDANRKVEVTFPTPMEIAAGDDTKSVQVPIAPIGEDNITIEVYCYYEGADRDWLKYMYTAGSAAQARNYMLTAKAKISKAGTGYVYSRMVDLSRLSSDIIGASDGMVLYNSTTSSVCIDAYANNATVTLYNVNIDHAVGENSDAIKCSQNTTLVLVGDNSVRGSGAGISIAEGKTLTIKGSGSLSAIGGDNAAGIGSHSGGSFGDIAILGGTITANGGTQGAGIGGGNATTSGGKITIYDGNVTAQGGMYGAGIGSGGTDTQDKNSYCGNIFIKGGTVEANGGYYGAGIGSGCTELNDRESHCGNINISGGEVTAHGFGSAAGIGSGYKNSYCGLVTISGGTVIAYGGTSSGAGIGSGFSSECRAVAILNTVTKVTACKGGNSALHSIGKGGDYSTCGSVNVGGANGFISQSPYTYEPSH